MNNGKTDVCFMYLKSAQVFDMYSNVCVTHVSIDQCLVNIIGQKKNRLKEKQNSRKTNKKLKKKNDEKMKALQMKPQNIIFFITLGEVPVI